MTEAVSPQPTVSRFPRRVGQITPHGSDVLDLARIVSAVLVVLYHARILVLGGDPPADWQTAIAYAWANCGTQAVFCFFVLSGYLVGGSVLLAARQNRFSFKSYWIARLSRLYIVLLPALCLGFVLDFTRHSLFGINHHAGYEIDESLQLITALGNCLFLQTLLVPPFGSNWPLWSLACEFWYYLLFPLLVLPFIGDRSGRPARVPLLIVGLAVLFVITMLNRSMAWLFVVWCLGAFARVAETWPVVSKRIPSERTCWVLALLLALAFPWVPASIRPIVTLSIGVIISAAVLAANRAEVPSWRNSRWIRRGSDFSFSLYVVHVPVLNFLVTVGRGQADPFIGVAPFSLAAPGLIALLTGIVCLIAFIFALVTESHTGWLRGKINETFTDRRAFAPRAAE